MRRAIIWLDSRADEQAAKAHTPFRRRRVVMRGRALSRLEGRGLKIVWLRENEPESSTPPLLSPMPRDTSFTRTGEMVLDHTGAGGTGMLGGRKRQWSRLLAELAGLPLEKMPPISSSIDIMGALVYYASRVMGLGSETQVIAGMADIPAAAAGSGALEDGEAHINIGTSSWLCISVSRPRNQGKYGIAPVVSADPEMYLMIGESETAGACLGWFAKNLCRCADARGPAGEGETFRDLDEIARQVEPGAGRLLFAPWMFGERSPVTDTSIRAAFVNLGLEHKREHLLRAVYEGVAYNLRWLLDAAAGAGLACDPLRAIGGVQSGRVDADRRDVNRRRVDAVVACGRKRERWFAPWRRAGRGGEAPSRR